MAARLGFAGFSMVRILPIRVIAFLALGSCGVFAQQGQDRGWNSLPDAPSEQVSSPAEMFQTLGAASPDLVGTEVHWPEAVRALQAGFGDLEKPGPKEPADFFSKHVRTALTNRNPTYRPLTSGSLLGRTTYAASRTLIASDPSGKNKLNTSYVLGVLTSAFVHTAYRPYWSRPVSAPFNDFGSTLGNDAGMNVLHEFGPGLQQLMKSHTPQFVSRIAERLGAK